ITPIATRLGSLWSRTFVTSLGGSAISLLGVVLKTSIVSPLIGLGMVLTASGNTLAQRFAGGLNNGLGKFITTPILKTITKALSPIMSLIKGIFAPLMGLLKFAVGYFTTFAGGVLASGVAFGVFVAIVVAAVGVIIGILSYLKDNADFVFSQIQKFIQNF